MNSIYAEMLPRRLGLDPQTGWAGAFWGYVVKPPLPLGQPNYYQLVGAVARPDLWLVWTIVGAASTLFPFLLMPVYVVFISRMALAWSLDRQVPEWLGEVSERLRAPANAIIATLAMAVIFLLFSNFAILKAVGLEQLAPSADPALDGKLNLVASAWFTILASSLSWINPGINAILARFTRPDLVKTAPFIKWLPWLGHRLAGVHRDPLLVRGRRADHQQPEEVQPAVLPEQQRRDVRRDRPGHRNRLVLHQGGDQPACRGRDRADVQVAAA